MKLRLCNGYPYPYPANATEQESEQLAEQAGGNYLDIEGVTGFERLHTVTVMFESLAAMYKAQAKTGWSVWAPLVLEAETSAADGYDHPAIIANGMAYCGHNLTHD